MCEGASAQNYADFVQNVAIYKNKLENICVFFFINILYFQTIFICLKCFFCTYFLRNMFKTEILTAQENQPLEGLVGDNSKKIW